MSDYQVIARKFRPQSFKDVMGQDAIVTTLKNAIRFKRSAQAYLFCGSRGTGKTTLARLFAKALNCQQLTEDCEPCNQCTSCREITAGISLDVIEIDGASHRGIEDIRQINENVGYMAASGGYKIYIIDEVHMLTKEAFNALLKTLEEPPAKVKFFFATTEPQKMLSTILSRCQRFNLNRIPLNQILVKLQRIAAHLGLKTEDDALRLIAQRAEGGLRDAESLFDQVSAFEEGCITKDSVASILGLMPREIYFEIDHAGQAGSFIKAFEIAHRVFSEGKDLAYFVEGLIDHLRHIALFKLSGSDSPLLALTEAEKEQFEQSARLYTQEQCLDLIEYLLDVQNQLRSSTFGKFSLEAVLLHVMRSHFRLPIEHLVSRLGELEELISDKDKHESFSASSKPTQGTNASSTPHALPPSSAGSTKPAPAAQISTPASAAKTPQPTLFDAFVSEDPTPSPSDLGRGVANAKPVKPIPQPVANPPSPPIVNQEKQRPIHHYDTLFQFATVELEGRLQKN